VSTEKLVAYHEVITRDGRSVDHYFIAPEGLGLVEAQKRRVGHHYKTRRGAELAALRFQEDLRS
jgi:hypothetical protein